MLFYPTVKNKSNNVFWIDHRTNQPDIEAFASNKFPIIILQIMNILIHLSSVVLRIFCFDLVVLSCLWSKHFGNDIFLFIHDNYDILKVLFFMKQPKNEINLCEICKCD